MADVLSTESLSELLADLAAHDGTPPLPPPPPPPPPPENNAMHVRERLRATLIARPPWPLDADLERRIYAVLEAELDRREIVDVAELATLGELADVSYPARDQTVLHRGDITVLRCDAIVNAANAELLGCFQPSHKCIDSVIHARAGPRLRAACASYLARQIAAGVLAAPVPVGSAHVTDAYALPARFVIHVPGPQVAPGESSLAAEHVNALAASYRACLDTAQAAGLRSIAFPCISTGLYGFDGRVGARVALHTVAHWLVEDERSRGQLRVVFVVFDEASVRCYHEALATVPCSVWSGALADAAAFDAARAASAAAAALRQAECVLIAGGAGLSVAAGLDYSDELTFARLFPEMAARGHRCFYEFIGYAGWRDEREKWAFVAKQALLVRWDWALSDVYRDLLAHAERIGEYFVLTSNVDGMFERHGFDTRRIFTAQGDYARMQCLGSAREGPCRQDAFWPARPVLERIRAATDDARVWVVDDSALPRCPHCGTANVFLNVRGGAWFSEAPHAAAAEAFAAWLATVADRRLVVLEIGAGFNTPTVIRGRCEKLVARLPNATLVRLNAIHASVPLALERTGRAIGIAADAAATLRAWL